VRLFLNWEVRNNQVYHSRLFLVREFSSDDSLHTVRKRLVFLSESWEIHSSLHAGSNGNIVAWVRMSCPRNGFGFGTCSYLWLGSSTIFVWMKKTTIKKSVTSNNSAIRRQLQLLLPAYSTELAWGLLHISRR
jgi:hypothetical protein